MSSSDNYLGKYYQVPLEGGALVIGLVVRQNESSLLSYFFQVDTLDDLSESALQPEHAFYIVMHGPLGFIQDEWPILGSLPSFQEAVWPVPPLKMLDRLRKVWMKLTYEDDLNTHTRIDISEEEAQPMFNAGVAGHVYVQKRVARMLEPVKE